MKLRAVFASCVYN